MNEWLPSRALLAASAGILLGAALAWWWWKPHRPAPRADTITLATTSASTAPRAVAPTGSVPIPVNAGSSSAPSPGPAAASPASERALSRPNLRTRQPDEDPTPDLSDYVNPGERPTMPQVIQQLQQAGVQGGLAAFPPPGTRPPLTGLAVPEDFALPDGYVRHYQATDDGQRIEAILMFAPDRQFTDANGQPVSIPENRVVPPELAPPGLPLRQIVVPPPADPVRR